MNIVISIHIMPNEIESYSRTIDILNKNIKKTYKNIILFSVLNCSDFNIDWSSSDKTKQFIINEYNLINKKLKIPKICNVYEGGLEFGVNTHRRETYKKFQTHDYIIYLDADLVFSESIITNYLHIIRTLKNPNWCVISPQTLKLWDSTWDCIVNKEFLPNYLNSYLSSDITKIHNDFSHRPRILRESNIFKFGGGWFTMYSTKLLNYVGIPNSFGTYGPDDTFLMNCMNLMKKRNYNVYQYILENEIVTERPLEVSYVKMKTNPRTLRLSAVSNFYAELNNFYKKL